MSKIIDQSPDPKSHIKTLMRIGYTLNSAVADIVDNSIAAHAKNIEVYAPPRPEEPFISIIDDGCGMSLDELVQNMRIGCKDPTEERLKGDLGRFGSGMKTASFSQATELTVITRKLGHPLVAARWDVEKIQETNSWSLEVYEGEEVNDIPEISPQFSETSGTQIIWRKLTSMDKTSHSVDSQTQLAGSLSDLKAYLALHFHRFMAGSDKRIFRVNSTPIEPIDPFMVGVPGYQEGPSAKMRCKGGRITIQTHVLPHIQNMDTKSMEALGGAEGITMNQGIYLYREKRLISAGGWMGMASNSQLSGLARVQVDVPSSLDNDWSTDVKKASLQMPPRVKRELRKFLSDPVKRSKRAYKYRGKVEAANRFWKICEDENTKSITYQIDPENNDFKSLLEFVGGDERRLLFEYLAKLAINLPINHIYEKMSERPKDVNQQDLEMDQLTHILARVFKE